MNSCRCPYCGKRISYFTALSIRRRGEYYCKKCKKESNVHIKKTIWVLFFAALVFALIILGYYLLITDRENPWFVFFVAVPFLLFYLFSPLFVRLRPKKKFQDSLYDTDMVNTPRRWRHPPRQRPLLSMIWHTVTENISLRSIPMFLKRSKEREKRSKRSTAVQGRSINLRIFPVPATISEIPSL